MSDASDGGAPSGGDAGGTALVTGATGLVGFNVVATLREQGRSVRALVRDPARAGRILDKDVELVRGDVTDKASMDAALDGCSVFYHAAGLPEQWLPDEATFDRVNARGTHNAVEAALEAGVRRFVYTSTIDVFTFPPAGDTFDESEIDPLPKHTAYERSKQEADRIVTRALRRGLPAVFLHPSGVYGPGPAASPGTNGLIADLAAGRLPMLLPGGMPVVFARDVGLGHVAAEQKAEVGSRYILSESYQSLGDVAATVREVTGSARIPPTLPLAVADLVARAGERISAWTGKAPLLPRGQLTFLGYEARPVADRARAELGWEPLEFKNGVERTLAYLAASDTG